MLKVKQEQLVKSSVQLALVWWPSQDPQDLLDPQVLLDPLACLVPSAPLVSQDDLVQRENKEKRETGESLGSRASASRVLKLSVPLELGDFPQWLDCLAHQDHQGPLEHQVLRVPLVTQKKAPQDAGVLLESQVLGYLDLEVREENLAALCPPQKPSLLDHQDLQDLQARRAHQGTEDLKGTKVNQANQVYQEVQGIQVLVSQVSLAPGDPLELRDQKAQVGPRVRQAQKAKKGHRDQKVMQGSPVPQESLESPWVLHPDLDHQAHLAHPDHLVSLEKMPLDLDLLMWANMLKSTSRVAASGSTWLALLVHQDPQDPLVNSQ